MMAPLIKRQTGFTLIIVLWFLTLLSVLSISYSADSRLETRLVANLIQEAKVKALAEAGIWQGVYQLINNAGNIGQLNQSVFTQGGVKYTIQDETGKLDINTARTEIFYSLLLNANINLDDGERLALFQAILDWRDQDQTKRTFGAEDNDYIDAGYNYTANDNLFGTTNELQRVKGMTPEIYKILAPSLTVFSHQPGVNPDSANAELIQALSNINKFQSTVEKEKNNDASESESNPLDIDPRFTTKIKSKVFSIISEGVIANTRSRIKAVILLKPDSNIPYSVLSWQLNAI